MSDKLIKTEIRGRKVVYYLTSKNDIEAIKTKNIFADIFLTLFSVITGGIVTISIDKIVRDKYNDLLILLYIIALIFLILYAVFIIQNRNTIKEITSASAYTEFDKVVPPEQALKIISATYYSNSTRWDAAKKLRSMIIDNQLDTHASNDLVGDPEPGKDKWLDLTYIFDGKEYTKTYNQGDSVNLP